MTSNKIRVDNARSVTWAEHVARMGMKNMHVEVWLGNLTERDHLKVPGVDGRKI
jgi:hypothetical protein